MTQDEINAMAKEAGAPDWWSGVDDANVPGRKWLARFAALVAEKEREACAQVCAAERMEFLGQSAANNGRASDFAFGSVNSAERIEAAIRARSQQ